MRTNVCNRLIYGNFLLTLSEENTRNQEVKKRKNKTLVNSTCTIEFWGVVISEEGFYIYINVVFVFVNIGIHTYVLKKNRKYCIILQHKEQHSVKRPY